MNSNAFLGKRAEDLKNIIEQQTQPIFDQLGIIAPINSCSTLLAIKELGAGSLVEIAKMLEQSHQLVKQKIPKLEKLGLIFKQPDDSDKRKTNYQLTSKGKKQVIKIKSYIKDSEKLIKSINTELGINIVNTINRTIRALQEIPLEQRYSAKPDKTRQGKARQL